MENDTTCCIFGSKSRFDSLCLEMSFVLGK